VTIYDCDMELPKGFWLKISSNRVTPTDHRSTLVDILG